MRHLLALLPLLGACASTAVVVKRERPPLLDVPADARIFVEPLEGEAGELVTRELHEELRRRGFAVVTAGDAEVRLAGRVTSYEVEESISENTHWCVKGKVAPSCTRRARTSHAQVAVEVSAVDGATHAVLATEHFAVRDAGYDLALPGADFPAARRDAMLAACRRKLAGEVLHLLTPHEVREVVHLRTHPQWPQLADAAYFARTGNWSTAIERYRTLLSRAEQLDAQRRAALHHNLGVALGYNGKFAEGIAELERAHAIDADDDILEHIGRIKELEHDAARLAASSARAKLKLAGLPRAERFSEADVRVTMLEAPEAPLTRLAVPHPQGSGVSEEVVALLGDAAVSEASRAGELAVIGAADLAALLGHERQRDLLGCTEVSCMAEVAGALDVDALLLVKLGKIGEIYRIGVDLIDSRKARPLVRGDVQGAVDADVLLGMLESTVRQVLERVLEPATPPLSQR